VTGQGEMMILAGGAKQNEVIEVFRYPLESESLEHGWDDRAEVLPANESLVARPIAVSNPGNRAEKIINRSEEDLAEISRLSFESGRERGIEEGRLAERNASAATEAKKEENRVHQIAKIAEQFSHERDRFLQALELEVVELALAIAARILRRESQMDPLLLTGAVRVALGQLSHATQVRLRVPSDELDLWCETMDHIPNLSLRPTVLGSDDMRLGDCILETELGSVDLGVRAQLGEIERGFFDRADRSKSQRHAATLQPSEQLAEG
jgi:flagellar biosynthesis/type III secretory pathway protein FliH